MIFRQPFAQAWRQQQLLLRQIGSVALWHKTLCNGSVHFRPANLRIPVGALSGAGRYYSDRLLGVALGRGACLSRAGPKLRETGMPFTSPVGSTVISHSQRASRKV